MDIGGRNTSPNSITNEFTANVSGFTYARGKGHCTNNNPALMNLRRQMWQGPKGDENIEINIEGHIKRGSNETDSDFVRIYFDWEESHRLIVIGYFGHMPNSMTSPKKR